MTETENKTTYTPGPWNVDDRDEDGDRTPNATTVRTGDGTLIAVFQDYEGMELPNFEANAHLIAAAPELLAACEIALDALHSWNAMGFNATEAVEMNRLYDESPEIRGIVTALAKARGAS